MKKIIISIIEIVTVIASAQLAYAQSPRAVERMEIRASAAAQRQENNLVNLKERGDNLITERLNSLQKLLTRVQDDKRLSVNDKASLTTDINTTITGLNTLKVKIDSDTDITTARADVKSIITNYRIYEIYEPKLILLIIINNLQTADSNLMTLEQKVKTLLTQLNGVNPTTTAALNDMTTQLTAINSLLNTDKTLLLNVTVATTDPKSIFTQVRKDLATVRADFAKIRNDIAQIRTVFKTILQGSISGKPAGSTESAK